MVSTRSPVLADSGNPPIRLEESDDFSVDKAQLLLDSGVRIFNDLSSAMKSCENIESIATIGKILSFVFEKETREELWALGGEAKKILCQPVFVLVVQYQAWVLDCMELFHEMNAISDSRVSLFMALYQGLDDFSDTHGVLTTSERQLRIVQSLIERPPMRIVEEVRRTISQRRLILYAVACIALNLLCGPIVGVGIIGLIGVEVSILLGLPSLLQLIAQRRVLTKVEEEVKE